MLPVTTAQTSVTAYHIAGRGEVPRYAGMGKTLTDYTAFLQLSQQLHVGKVLPTESRRNFAVFQRVCTSTCMHSGLKGGETPAFEEADNLWPPSKP